MNGKGIWQYVSLDDEEHLRFANGDAKAFVDALNAPGTAFDECQLSEPLFPALKERVRRNKRPGQFYLSGSVRFTSKKQIRESLTGRIMTADLYPLTLSELDGGELPDWVPRIMQSRRMHDLQIPALSSREHRRRHRLIGKYAVHGGAARRLFHPHPEIQDTEDP